MHRRTLRSLVTAGFLGSIALLLAALAVPPPPPAPEALAAVDAAADTAAPEAPAEAAEPPAPAGPVWVEHRIQKGEVLSKILPRYGMPTRAVRAAAKDHYDLARIQAGKVLRFRTQPGETQADRLEYALGEDRTLVVERTVRPVAPETAASGEASATGEAAAPDAAVPTEEVVWTGHIDEVQYESREVERSFTVRSSLWAAAAKAGLRPRDIAGLAQVYRWDIDFNTEIRAGATAEMVVEELMVDGEAVKLGAPLAVRFVNAGEEYVAIRWTSADGSTRYFDASGKARKKPFLRSPLDFSRVTSGFNSKGRFHPVLKRRRPHYGVDFGARKGTPVRAVGDAVVSYSGTNGGHGRYVKLDHEGPYDSSYSHLSRISVRKGQRVKQGDIIGYVGSTGLATGPHLHYQFWVNGKYVNPLTVKLPNSGASVPDGERKAFFAHRDRLLAQLGSTETDAPAVADADE